MARKIIVYGDSFSTPEQCDTTCDNMWYRHVVEGNGEAMVLNRARPGNNSRHMFLEATHDCLTHKDPVDLMIGLGPLQRLPKYTDGWYDHESMRHTPETTLAECTPYLASHTPNELELSNRARARTMTDALMEMYHPTLLWANLYKDVIGLHTLAQGRGHRLLVVHMHHHEFEHNRHHTLTRPLEQEAAQCHYMDQTHSCHAVCKRAGILPWDHAQFDEWGHHSAEGQRHFGLHVRALLAESTTWN